MALATPRESAESYLCPHCERVFPTKQGVDTHIRRGHNQGATRRATMRGVATMQAVEEPKAKAPKAKKGAAPVSSPDEVAERREMFARVAAATKVLVPDPDEVYLRAMEIGQLQAHMITFLGRK